MPRTTKSDRPHFLPMPRTTHTVNSLRAEAKATYAGGKGNRALKGYSSMKKAQLEKLLGKQTSGATSARFQHKQTADRISKLAPGIEEKLGGKEKILNVVKKAVDKVRADALDTPRPKGTGILVVTTQQPEGMLLRFFYPIATGISCVGQSETP